MPGIVYDHINVLHTLKFGIPQPTNDMWGGGDPIFKTEGIYTFYLRNFPKNQLPSGGMSGRVSASEVAMACLKAQDYEPKNDAVTFTWKRGEKVLSKTRTSDFNEHGASQYWSCDYSFIGHFDWEIKRPCNQYSVHIDTAWGDALIEFEVK